LGNYYCSKQIDREEKEGLDHKHFIRTWLVTRGIVVMKPGFEVWFREQLGDIEQVLDKFLELLPKENNVQVKSEQCSRIGFPSCLGRPEQMEITVAGLIMLNSIRYTSETSLELK